MGFAATVRNNSSGTVSGIAVQQSLPPGSGVAWSVASQSGSSGTVGRTPRARHWPAASPTSVLNRAVKMQPPHGCPTLGARQLRMDADAVCQP